MAASRRASTASKPSPAKKSPAKKASPAKEKDEKKAASSGSDEDGDAGNKKRVRRDTLHPPYGQMSVRSSTSSHELLLTRTRLVYPSWISLFPRSGSRFVPSLKLFYHSL
jgi:hypothetical protein